MTYEEALRRVEEGERFEDHTTLKLTNKNGWTVAHYQAHKGWTTEDLEILRLVDKYGRTVAHYQLENGWRVTF